MDSATVVRDVHFVNCDVTSVLECNVLPVDLLITQCYLLHLIRTCFLIDWQVATQLAAMTSLLRLYLEPSAVLRHR